MTSALLRTLLTPPPQGIDRNFYQTSLFELNSPQFDPAKTNSHGKIFVLTDDENQDNRVDINDLQWQYLDGDGDFRSDEVRKLRDEADIIITNPPFSLFREFLAWIIEAGKQFSIIGNMNAITYKEVFPLIAANKIWLGPTISSGDREFQVPNSYPVKAAGWRIDEHGNKFLRIKGVRWFTNLEHGRRHQPLPLMTMEQNLKFSKHKEIRGKDHYEHYDNYDAIEVPYTDAIPSDYDGVMGVPISFLDKYCPEQFEIIWQASGNTRASAPPDILKLLSYHQHPEDRGGCTVANGRRTYGRILIKQRSNS